MLLCPPPYLAPWCHCRYVGGLRPCFYHKIGTFPYLSPSADLQSYFKHYNHLERDKLGSALVPLPLSPWPLPVARALLLVTALGCWDFRRRLLWWHERWTCAFIVV